MDIYTSPADIVPAPVEIQVSKKPYELHRWTLAMDAWVNDRFGRKTMEFMQSMTDGEMGQLIFKLLVNKDDFVGYNEKIVDDEGHRIERWKPGYELLMERIATAEERKEMVDGLLKCFGLGQPQIDQVYDAVDDGALESAKKEPAGKKKKPRRRKTGA